MVLQNVEKHQKKGRETIIIRPKYRNKKIVIDGITFDSTKEARRYQELCLLLRAGEISDLELQKEYILIPTQREADSIGKRGGKIQGKVIEHAVKYKADFSYKMNGKEIVEDTKGFKTKDYIIKRKLMLLVHGIRIKEV